MSETQNEVSITENAENGGEAQKGSKKIIIILVALLLVGGGGGGFYFMRGSSAEADETTEKSEKKTKSKKDSKVSDEESDEEEKPSKKSSTLKSALPKDENVKSVIELPPFIVNLADTEQARYLRMSVSLGVGGEGGEKEKPDQLFMTRVRNAMLAILSEKKSDDILTNEGKAKLRKELLKAAQAASEEPHVEAIYITDFIVQL